MKRLSRTQYNKFAYCGGITAKENGLERNSPYKSVVAEKYWLAGYDGVVVKNFNNWHKTKK